MGAQVVLARYWSIKSSQRSGSAITQSVGAWICWQPRTTSRRCDMTRPPPWSRVAQFTVISAEVSPCTWAAAAERVRMLRWVRVNALGNPVLPEVSSITTGSSGAGWCTAAAAGPALSSSRPTSRAPVHCRSAANARTGVTRSGLVTTTGRSSIRQTLSRVAAALEAAS